ncbi:MAG: division/cell wall cluster transcriptional repressor MraZ [Aeromicrobium sp.]
MSLDAKHFIGEHTPKLDDKGRLFLPAKFRPRLAEGVVLMRGQERCVFGWTIDAYQAIVERLQELPFTNRDSRNLVRMVTAGSFEEKLDAQGLVLIPPKLREWALLDRDVTVIGAGNRFEIWNSARWDEFFASQEEPWADLSGGEGPAIF